MNEFNSFVFLVRFRRLSHSDGAASMGFHADPSNLFYDPASGDYGLAFYGHTHNTVSANSEVWWHEISEFHTNL